MRPILVACTIVALVVLVCPSAFANPSGQADASAERDFITLGAGARVGGYGFRDVDSDGQLRWDDCRMNGVGLFGTVDFGKYLFAELSVDYYHAVGEVIDAGMNRQSAFLLAAGGVRLFPEWIISPYLQAGAGPEWTKIEVASTSETHVLPTAFLGVGGELDLWGLKLGTHVRVFAMAEPVHGLAPGGHHRAPAYEVDGSRSIELEYEVAGQMQFFVRRAF